MQCDCNALAESQNEISDAKLTQDCLQNYVLIIEK